MKVHPMSDTAHLHEILTNAIDGDRKPFILKGDNDRQFSAVPMMNGQWEFQEIHPLENERAPIPPKIVTQAVKLQQVESMVAYLNRFKNGDSLLFANIQTNTILATIDYHRAPELGEPTATHNKHSATLVLPFSLEWQIWTSIDGKLMSHVDFANFLEENGPDVLPLGTMRDAAGNMIEDAPSTMLELVRELQVKSNYGASSAIRNGDYVSIEMQKADDISTKRSVALPNQIDINIPVYFGEAPVLVHALIRRRVDDGALKLGIKLVRPEQARQDEFKRIVLGIEQDTMVPAHYGTPA